jgi:transcriptional regulator with XRE-family HTH domain
MAEQITPLRKARQDRNETLKTVADAVGLDTGSLSRIEQGKQGCSPETAAKLAGYFGADEITEMQILYPERYLVKQPEGAVSAP